MERQGPSYGEVVIQEMYEFRPFSEEVNPYVSEPGGGRVDYVYMNYMMPNPSACGGGWLI